MPFSKEDKALSDYELIPVQKIRFTDDSDGIFNDKLQRKELDTCVKNIRETRSTDHRRKSGRSKHARTEEKVTTVNELVGLLSHECQKQTHRLARQISRETGLTLCSYNHSPRSWSKVSFVYQTRLLLFFLHFLHLYITG